MESSAWCIGTDPGRDAEDGGPSSTKPQVSVVTSTQMGSLYVFGNVPLSQNADNYSTVTAPLSVHLDVDQSDFAQMQRCVRAPNWAVFDASCLRP